MFFFFFKQKTAYEVRISYWSSDVCSSDLADLDRLIGRAGVDRVLDQMRDDLFHPLRIAHDRTVLPAVEQHRMRLALVPRQRFEQPAKRHGHTLVSASLVVLGKAGKQVVLLSSRALQRSATIGPTLGPVRLP